MDIEKLDNLFCEYGYEVKEKNSNYRVYLLNQGMYHGAEVVFMDRFDASSVKEKYSKLGYHAIEQHFSTIEQAEDYLFHGFFNTATTENDIQRRYDEFACSQVKHYYSDKIRYHYIGMPYSVYKEQSDETIVGNLDIVTAIKSEVEREGAHLIVVEAAAGFGKTCTAYEVYKSFANETQRQKPIFTELSRNRDAKQFKYVLWSEIDREKDTVAKQDLVVYNIKKGKIPLIIDGFDELLTKDIDSGKAEEINEFEQVETMLSTIGDLLKDNAKVVLTSRKTAIFSGTEFSEWVENHSGEFDVVRFQLGKPDIKQWLPSNRYEEIRLKNVPIDYISNPVLLTYLRNVGEDEFTELLSSPESITEKYFKHLLNREKERQNLAIPWEEQMTIFENLAKTFAEFDIVGEERSFVKELIRDYNKPQLMYYKEFMTTKQTIDELADTLTNHALLDRPRNKDFITFVNDFVHGYLLGRSIQTDASFLKDINPLPLNSIELAILAYKYASKDNRGALWNKIQLIRKDVPLDLSLTIDGILLNKITCKYASEGITSHLFENVLFSSKDCFFADVAFIDTTFINCVFDPKAFECTSFTGCKFHSCKVADDENVGNDRQIRCYGCDDFSSGFILKFCNYQKEEILLDDVSAISMEIQLLSKYFKVDGKTPKMRYISSIKKDFKDSGQDLNLVFAVFDSLKKKGMLLVDGNNSYIAKLGITYYHKNMQS